MLKFSKISTNNLKELQKFITPSNNPKFFIHFSFVKRFGINPTSKYKTPLGFCAYPLTKEMYDHLISDSLPFAQDRPYILVFSVQNNLLNLINYNQKDLERDVLKLKNLTDKYNFNELVDIACKNARLNTPAGKFWSITRDFSNFDPKKWRSILMQLDYYGVNDAGLGIIHPNEPTQSVIFEQQSIIPIDILINPNTAFKFDIFSGLTKHERNMVENANKLRKQMYDSKYNKPKNHQFTIDDIKDIILNPNSYVNDPIITTHDIEKLNFKFKDFLNLFPSKKRQN